MNNQSRSSCRKASVGQDSILPMEIVNHDMLFRQTHPAAKLIQELKKKCNLCVVCMKKSRHNDLECCSTSCYRQMNDGPWFDYPSFEGQQFWSILCRPT